MSFTPQESHSTLTHERALLDGTILCGLAYGMHTCVFAACIYFLVKSPTKERMAVVNFSFVTALFLLGTLWFASNLKVSELSFIDNRNYPGNTTLGSPAGPYGWISDNYFTPANVLGSVAYYIANILSDGLLLYRTWIFWNRNYWVIAAPLVFYIADIGTGGFTCYYNSIPPTSFTLYALPYFIVSNVLNIFLTVLIVVRLIVQARRVNKALNSPRHGYVYTSVASIVIESATPYSICAIIYIVTYALKHPVCDIALPILGQVMCMSPELIILRVALGRSGWNASAKPLFSQPNAFPRPQSIAIATQRTMRWQVSGGPDSAASPGTPLDTFSFASPLAEKGVPRGLPTVDECDGKSSASSV